MTASKHLTAAIIALLLASLPLTTAAQEKGDEVTVRGTVLDPAGKPAAGARVQAVAWPFKSALSESRSAAEGSFTITFKKSQFDSTTNSWETAIVAATEAGFAPAWASWDHVDASGKLVLKLAPDDIPVEGRILNLEGQGVAEAKITITNLEDRATDLKSLSVTGSTPLEDVGNQPAPNLPGFAVAIDQPIVADNEGRFRIHGLGKNRTVDLRIQGPGIANSWMQLVTQNIEKQTRTFQYQPFAMASTRYGAKFEFTAPPGRIVTGTVRDADSGRPLAGVSILDGSRTGPVTDSEGRYRVEGVPKRKTVTYIATPNDQQPYFICQGEVSDAAGMGPLTLDFKLHRGVWVTGKLTDKSTGDPIHSARLYYLPYLSNKNFDKLPEFHFSNRAQIPGGQGDWYLTRADGSFRLVALPGPALVTVTTLTRSYRTGPDLADIKYPRGPGRAFLTYEPRSSGEFANAIKEIDVPEGRQETTLNLQCDPGLTLHLSLVDTDNHPVVGAVLGGRKLKGDVLDVFAFRPDERRRVFILDPARKIGRIITLGPADAPEGKTAVTLQPYSYITGRLVNEDGLPVANAALQGFVFSLPAVNTDADGRFRMTVIPGDPYNLRGFKDGQEFQTDIKNFTLPPGSTKDLGDIHRRSFN